MKLKIIALFIIFLLINSTFVYSDLSNPIEDVESGIEKTGEALSTFEATDIIINVDSYLPTVLSEQAFESDQPGGYPIWVTLTGMKTNPLMDLQKLYIPSIRATGASTKYVKSVYYKPPKSGYFDLDNLGYVIIRLRKLKEDEVPDRLDINMTADIQFQIQNGFGINENDLILPILTEEEFLNEKTKYSFWGGRGYIRLANIRGDDADLIVYDGRLNKNGFSVKQGKISTKKFLTGGVPYLLFEKEEDFIGRNLRNSYKVRVNEITGNKDKAKVEMLFNGEFKLKEFVEGQELYEGSNWKVKDVKPAKTDRSYDEVEFINEETLDRLLLKGGKFLYIPSEKIPSEGDHISSSQLNEWVEGYSGEYGVDSNLIKGLIQAESAESAESEWRNIWTGKAQNFINTEGLQSASYEEQDEAVMDAINKNKINSSAFGYGQITGTTASGILNYDRLDRFDPEKNIEMTVFYMNKLLEQKSGVVRDALRAYTGGSGGEAHIKKILEYTNLYKGGKTIPSVYKGKDEEIDSALNQRYKSINSLLQNLIKDKPDDPDYVYSIDPVLKNYKEFLSEISKSENKNFYNKYIGLVFNDLSELEESYRESDLKSPIADHITEFILSIKGYISIVPPQQIEEVDVEETSKYYFEKAIENYRTVVETYPGADFKGRSVAMDAQEKIAMIYDYNLKRYDESLEEYRKLISLYEDYPSKDAVENRIALLEIRRNYLSNTLDIFENGNSISLSLYNVNKADEKSEVRISIDGTSDIYSFNKVNFGDTGWYLKEINNNNILVGNLKEDNKETTKRLRLNDRQVLDGHVFILEDINLKQEVHITVLPGEEKLTTKSNFMLHIPVEPRLWKLTPEQINNHINASRKLIDAANKAINVIENVYKLWSLSCYTTFIFLLAKNTWFGTKTGDLARKTVMSSWKERCVELASNPKENYKGNVVKCITNNKEIINQDLEKTQKVLEKEYKNVDDRTLALAKETFFNTKLNEEYDKEAFDIEANRILESGLTGKENEQQLKTKRRENTELLLDKKKRQELIDNGINGEIIDKNLNLIRTRFGLDENNEPIKVNPSEFEEGLGIEFPKSLAQDGYLYRPGELDPYRIYDKEDPNEIITDAVIGKTYYYRNPLSGKLQPFKLVDKEVDLSENYKKTAMLIKSGKWKGKIDKLSVDSRTYLRVSKRGSDGIPLEVELWGRYSKFGSQDNLPLSTKEAYRIRGTFGLEDCERGSTSDREGVDVLASLKKDYPDLQKACKDLTNLDRQKILTEKKPGEYLGNYFIENFVQETGGLECFDVMGIDDCLILFSVCDPVMCPATRFNAGGKWNVDNVVSTGIFGSIFLGTGLWDFKRIPPEVGVCVPGIDAGLKNYRSLIQGYEECLVARRDKGENVGICDTIRSIGYCKIAWREGTSFLRLNGGALDLVYNLINKAGGGGEYAYFQSNIQRTGDFLKFFTSEYATTYFSAYRGYSTDEIGEELCKAAIYGKIPGRGTLLDQLVKPEGPAQFMGWFTEIPHSDVGEDLISDYEVYYHIYAGEDREQVRYVVYLNDLDDLSRRLYITRTTGYLNRGDFVDETIRRTEATGYDELCIVIDNQEHCGFGRVSSDLVLDVVEDELLEKGVKQKDIKNEEECTGESIVFTQPGAESFVDAMYPGLLRSGLVRVCSKEDPGKGVDDSAWKDVGTCGQNKLGQDLGRCWLSKQSYKDALSEYDTKRRKEAEELFKKLSELGLEEDKKIEEKIILLINTRNFATTLKQGAEIQFSYVIEQFKNLKTFNIDLNAKINYEIGETYYELAVYSNKKKIEVESSQPEGISKRETREETKEGVVPSEGETGEQKKELFCEIEYNDNTFEITKNNGNLYRNLFIKISSDGKAVWKLRDWGDRYQDINNLNKINKEVYLLLHKELLSRIRDLKSVDSILYSIIYYAYQNDHKLELSREGKEKIELIPGNYDLEHLNIVSTNALNYCFGEGIKQVPKGEESFIEYANGFDILFGESNVGISNKAKDEIGLYIEENYPFTENIEKTLQIVSYSSLKENDLKLAEQRLNSVLGFLQSKPYVNYINGINIQKEVIKQTSESEEYLGIRVQVRFIELGNEEIQVKSAEVCSKPKEEIGDTCTLSDSIKIQSFEDTLIVTDSGKSVTDSTVVVDTSKGIIVGETDEVGKFDYFSLGDVINYNPVGDKWKLKKVYEVYVNNLDEKEAKEIEQKIGLNPYRLLEVAIKSISEALSLSYNKEALKYIYSIPVIFTYKETMENACAYYGWYNDEIYLDLTSLIRNCEWGETMVHEVMHALDSSINSPENIFNTEGIREYTPDFLNIIASDEFLSNKFVELYYYLSNQFDNEIVARVMADFIYQDIYDIEQYNHDKIFHPLISYPNLNVVHIPKIILIFYKDVINPKYKYLLDKGSSQSISSKELPFIILTYKERDRFIFKSLNEKYQFKILGETSIYALKLVGLDESKSTFDLYKNSNKIGTISVGHRLPPDLEKGTITKFSLDNNLNLIVRSWVSNIQGKVPEDVDISLLLEGK